MVLSLNQPFKIEPLRLKILAYNKLLDDVGLFSVTLRQLQLQRYRERFSEINSTSHPIADCFGGSQDVEIINSILENKWVEELALLKAHSDSDRRRCCINNEERAMIMDLVTNHLLHGQSLSITSILYGPTLHELHRLLNQHGAKLQSLTLHNTQRKLFNIHNTDHTRHGDIELLDVIGETCSGQLNYLQISYPKYNELKIFKGLESLALSQCTYSLQVLHLSGIILEGENPTWRLRFVLQQMVKLKTLKMSNVSMQPSAEFHFEYCLPLPVRPISSPTLESVEFHDVQFQVDYLAIAFHPWIHFEKPAYISEWTEFLDSHRDVMRSISITESHLCLTLKTLDAIKQSLTGWDRPLDVFVFDFGYIVNTNDAFGDPFPTVEMLCQGWNVKTLTACYCLTFRLHDDDSSDLSQFFQFDGWRYADLSVYEKPITATYIRDPEKLSRVKRKSTIVIKDPILDRLQRLDESLIWWLTPLTLWMLIRRKPHQATEIVIALAEYVYAFLHSDRLRGLILPCMVKIHKSSKEPGTDIKLSIDPLVMQKFLFNIMSKLNFRYGYVEFCRLISFYGDSLCPEVVRKALQGVLHQTRHQCLLVPLPHVCRALCELEQSSNRNRMIVHEKLMENGFENIDSINIGYSANPRREVGVFF